MIKLHPQLQQLINLFLLLIVGKYVAHIYLTWKAIVGILFFTFFIEHVFYYVRNKTLNFISFSSLSTAIGVLLMMVTTNYYIYLIIVALALFQKQFLRYNNQHFFNPSNFALIMGLLFFYNDAHIVLGQLGDQFWLMITVSILAVLILYRVGRWVLSLSFIVSYLFFQYFVIVSTDPVVIFDDLYYRFYSISFVVFILFMLTDPKTTPHKMWHQIFFAMAIAMSATLLDYFYGFRVQHLFMVLFLLTPLRVFLDQYFKKFHKKVYVFISFTVLLLALSAIIYIEIQPPYYFEMDG